MAGGGWSTNTAGTMLPILLPGICNHINPLPCPPTGWWCGWHSTPSPTTATWTAGRAPLRAWPTHAAAGHSWRRRRLAAGALCWHRAGSCMLIWGTAHSGLSHRLRPIHCPLPPRMSQRQNAALLAPAVTPPRGRLPSPCTFCLAALIWTRPTGCWACTWCQSSNAGGGRSKSWMY